MTGELATRAVREQWRLVVAAAVIGLLVAGPTFLALPRTYAAQLQLYVAAQVVGGPQAAYEGAQLSEERVASYTELLTSPRVGFEVARRLSLSETPDAVIDHLEATSRPETVLLEVTATDTSPTRAAELANAVGQVFPRMIDDLERRTSRTGQAPVAVRVVEAAEPPPEPSSPGLVVFLGLGLVIGAAVGVGAALVRRAFDSSVRNPEDLQNCSDAPSLGMIGVDTRAARSPLVVLGAPMSPDAEAYRGLRTNLQYVDVDRPPRVILATSAVEGEGKSTVVANLAVALTMTQKRVVVVEADLRRPRVAALLGEVDSSVGLTTVLAGRVDLDEAVQPAASAVHVLAAGIMPPNPSELLASRQMQEVLEALRRRYDVVLVDSPPLLAVTDAAAMGPFSDGALLVCRFGKTSGAAVRSTAESLAAVSTRVLGTVMTMVPRHSPWVSTGYEAYVAAGESVPPAHADAGRTSSRAPRRSSGTMDEQHPTSPRPTSHRPSVPGPTASDRRHSRRSPTAIGLDCAAGEMMAGSVMEPGLHRWAAARAGQGTRAEGGDGRAPTCHDE